VENKQITLPKKPRIKQREAPPDGRKFAVLPVAAVWDKQLKNVDLRVLAALCAYANRAGICYVGQIRVAADLHITQPMVSNCVTRLTRQGYLQMICHGVQGVRGQTLRVVFDPNLTLEDAVAIAQSKANEDVRTPKAIEQEHEQLEKEWSDNEIKENKRRLANLLITTFKTPDDKQHKNIKNNLIKDSLNNNINKTFYTSESIRNIREPIKEPFYMQEHIGSIKISNKDINKQSINDTLKDVNDTSKGGDKIKNDMPESIRTQKDVMSYGRLLKKLNEVLFEEIKEKDLKLIEVIDGLKVSEQDVMRVCVANPAGTVEQVCLAIINDAQYKAQPNVCVLDKW
jgi:hypothetical protein